jgi:hypothetical protein
MTQTKYKTKEFQVELIKLNFFLQSYKSSFIDVTFR